MKYFEGRSGVEIAEELCISAGRVSQITKTALEKVKKAYLLALEQGLTTLTPVQNSDVEQRENLYIKNSKMFTSPPLTRIYILQGERKC